MKHEALFQPFFSHNENRHLKQKEADGVCVIIIVRLCFIESSREKQNKNE